VLLEFFFSSRRRHTRFSRDWSSDVCSSDLTQKKYSGSQNDIGDASAHGLLFPWLPPSVRFLKGNGFLSKPGLRLHSSPDPPSPRSEERRVGQDRPCRRRPSNQIQLSSISLG